MSANTTRHMNANTGSGALSVLGASVAQLEALADQPLGQTRIALADTAAAISADLALRGSSAILALLANITAISVTDHGTITLTAAQALTGGVDDGAHSAIALATGGGFAITGASVAQLGALRRLPVLPDHIGVTDGAAAVLAGLENLLSPGVAVRVELTDNSVPAALVPQLVRLGGMLANGVPVHDAAMPIVTLAGGDDAAAAAWLDLHGAELGANGWVTVADMAVVSRLARFDKAGHRLSVWDSAARLTAPGAAEALASPLIDGIFLRAEAAAVTLTAAGAVALFAIQGFSATDPDGSANRITVADSAAEIDAVHARLATLSSPLSNIAVNANGAVSAATLARLQALGAIAGIGVALTVRDSATGIAATAADRAASDAVGEAPWQSINAVAWVLSSSAIVSVAEALALARHQRFSAAPYTLTLARDAVVTVAELRTLATLGAGLTCGGHVLTVCDTAANLAGSARHDAMPPDAMELAATLCLAGADTVDAATAETLLQNSKFVPGAALTIADSAANLLHAKMRAVFAAHPHAADIHTMLAAPETLDAAAAAACAALPNFTDAAGHLRTLPALLETPGVTLGFPPAGAGAFRHSAGAAFGSVANTLSHAGTALTDAIALDAIASLSADVAGGAATITLAEGASARHPSAFAMLRADAVPPGNPGTVAAVNLSKVNVYGVTGSLLSATVEQGAGFVVSAPDGGRGQAFSVTESVDGRESAPVVVLDAGTLEGAVYAAHAEFAASGAIEVQSGKFLDLYTAGSVPVLDRPALVYDPSAHTIELDIPGQPPVPLIVLGASAPPAALNASEILVRQAS